MEMLDAFQMRLKDILKGKKAAIFDFDGIIVDTEQASVDTAVEVFRLRGAELDIADRDDKYGKHDLTYYSEKASKKGVTEKPENLLEEHNRVYDRVVFEIREPLPGVRDAVALVNNLGIVAGICSGSYRYQIEGILKNIDLQAGFRHITSAEDTEKHKPYPDPYLAAMKILGLHPSETVAFEDSRNGVLSAKATGIYVVGVMIGNHGTQNLQHADVVVHSLLDLLE